MTATILHLPNGGHKVIEHRTASIATGAPEDGRMPVFELGVPEMLVIRGFMERALDDVRLQVQRSAAAGMGAHQLKKLKSAALAITAWQVTVIASIDSELESALIKPPSDTEESNT